MRPEIGASAGAGVGRRNGTLAAVERSRWGAVESAWASESEVGIGAGVGVGVGAGVALVSERELALESERESALVSERELVLVLERELALASARGVGVGVGVGELIERTSTLKAFRTVNQILPSGPVVMADMSGTSPLVVGIVSGIEISEIDPPVVIPPMYPSAVAKNRC